MKSSTELHPRALDDKRVNTVGGTLLDDHVQSLGNRDILMAFSASRWSMCSLEV